MSLVVGIKSGDTVFVGADSLCAWNNLVHITKDSQIKIYKRKDTGVIIGHSGWVVDANIISMSDDIIDNVYKKKTIRLKEMVNDIVPKIMSLLESRGRIENQSGIKKMHSEFILAHKSQLFVIQTDGCVTESYEDYISIGSGIVVADGVFQAIKDDNRLTVQQKIVKIIMCACAKEAYVSYPIKILNTKNDEVITIKDEAKARKFIAVK